MIRFACSNCRRYISVDDRHADEKGKCPKCGNVVIVPKRSTIIAFHCENCGQKIKVPESYAGRKGKCPKCKDTVLIPSLEKESPERPGTPSVACPMCGEAIDLPPDSRGQLIECPECGGYVEISPEGVPAVSAESDASMPPTAEEDLYQEEPELPREPSGVDRRLILVISGVAVVVVVGLVILAAVLRSFGSKPVTSDSQPVQFRLDQVQDFAEQYMGLLGDGELDEADQFLSPGLAGDLDRPQVERLSSQIGRGTIIEMDCRRTYRKQAPEGERTFLWYDLGYEDGEQTVIVSVIQTEQALTIDGIAAQDHLGSEVSIGPNTFDALSRVVTTAARQTSRLPPARVFRALAIGFAIGTVFSATCLWIGMKVTNVEGTFVAMLGVAAISSLAGVAPAFIGLGPCARWLLSLIVMFALICKWTDADFWPDAIGMVLVASLVGIIASLFLGAFAVGV
ncbi:MAG: hypothetical protein ACYTAS_16220 [Planctomycetota bacterium]|jgi:DNA-directed RNA polymerase subunit RPC12/RpoP